MTSTELVPAPGDERGGSALSDFLRHTTVYERAGAVIPRDLIQFGFLGSIVVIATGLLALAFPSAQAIEHGGFFLLLGGMAAGLAAFLHSLAVPAILWGLALLGLDIYLMRVPTSEQWRAAVVAQATAGGVGGALSTLFLALLLLNLAIWIAIIACAIALGLAILAALANG